MKIYRIRCEEKNGKENFMTINTKAIWKCCQCNLCSVCSNGTVKMQLETTSIINSSINLFDIYLSVWKKHINRKHNTILFLFRNKPLLNSIHFSHFFMYKSMKNNNNTYATRCVWTKVYKILILIIKCFFHFYCYVDEATHNITTGTIRPFWLNWKYEFSGKTWKAGRSFSYIHILPRYNSVSRSK